MSFVYPAALWALPACLGALILVCLIRKKYNAVQVPSVYLWRLAERLQKKSRTRRRIKKMLLLMLQLACMALACLIIAQPLMRLPGADTHYVAILDGSGSMRIAGADGKTRFERAKAMADHDLKKLPLGSSVTVILAGDTAQTLCLRAGADEAAGALAGAVCGYGSGDIEGALELCSKMLEAGEAITPCLYTDEAVQAENLAVADARGEGEWNVSAASLAAEGSIYGTSFEAQVISAGRDAGVSFELWIDGQKLAQDALQLRVNGQEAAQDGVYCPADEAVSVSLLARKVYDYADARLVVLADDGLKEDNEYRLHVPPEKTTRVLLAGERTYFIERALSVFASAELHAQKSIPVQQLSGYDLYVFDGCMPDSLPEDGAVWLINPPRSPRNLQIVFGDALMGTYISANRGLEGDAARLTENLSLADAAVVRFREVTAMGRFTPVITCGAYPVLLAGHSERGFAQLVMPFDLQDSNLPLLTDYVILMNNMLDYSVPPLLDAQDYACGARVYPRTLASCEKLFVQLPDMSIRTLSEEEAQQGISLGAPGSYTLMQELEGGKERLMSAFAHMPKGESLVSGGDTARSLSLGEPAQQAEDAPLHEGQRVPVLRLLTLALLALLMLEWVVYHREQY